jgi:hypothetical protein
MNKTRVIMRSIFGLVWPTGGGATNLGRRYLDLPGRPGSSGPCSRQGTSNSGALSATTCASWPSAPGC